MRRAAVSSAATAAGIILLLSLKPHQAAGPTAVISSDGSDAPGAAAGPSDAASPSAGATGSTGGRGPSSGATGPGGTGPSSAATVAGGTRKVIGNAANTRYGLVQVEVTLSGSRITTVDVIKYPTEDRRDREINSSALPLLNQEAIAAQSAGIDVVSGATFTSQGYIRSLQSALDRAGR
ncbi:FMN-binding protein [Kitasatospora sp. RG8]|uniref:FMN-binding protein n=1 Tax=Kitasatospora sp. RG8 TaxID=2820815 RepID=UPI001ADFFEAA|nr:FMN-binding protein [Kitasatospora sp. RG8]MBP0450591.1 FMN-binding protein [Kitasatospora sp. RG8]